MMLRFIIAASAVLSLTAVTPATAQSYAGLFAGKTSWSLSCNASCTADKADTGMTIGYDLNHDWSIETSLSKLSNINDPSKQIRFRSYHVDGAGLYRFIIQNNLVAFGKFGFAYTRFSPDSNQQGVSSSHKVSPLFGAGLAYKLTDLAVVRGEIEATQVKLYDHTNKITSVRLGVQKSF